MNCRLANSEDLSCLKELWYECFLEHDSKASIDYYFENSFDLEHTFVLEVAGEIVTSLQLNQHYLIKDKLIEPVSFIIGVATFNKHRKKGYMRILLEYAINYARDNYQQNYMILQAYNWDIYRPFGFEERYYKSNNNYQIAELEKYPIVELHEFDDVMLLEIYQEYTKNFDGYKQRDEKYFVEMMKANQVDGVKLAMSEQAYIFYSQDADVLIASEVAFKTREDLFSLLKTVALKESCQGIKFYSDIINFSDANRDIFMMVKELGPKKFVKKSNLYISEWI